MNEITINTPKGDVVINVADPTFEQLQGAYIALETVSGKMNKLAAGNFIIETCIVPEDRDKWTELKKESKAQAAAASEAVELVYIYTSELKKK